MTTQDSLMYRIGTGTFIGLLLGLVGFLLVPYCIDNPPLLFRSAILLWYPTLGALIGLFGVFAYHPILNFPMPWWFRGAIMGGWMNFILALVTDQQLAMMVIITMREYSAYTTPFWFVLEGGLVGIAIDYIATRFFGEGWADITDRQI